MIGLPRRPKATALAAASRAGLHAWAQAGSTHGHGTWSPWARAAGERSCLAQLRGLGGELVAQLTHLERELHTTRAQAAQSIDTGRPRLSRIHVGGSSVCPQS